MKRMHSSRMRTACTSSHPRGVSTRHPLGRRHPPGPDPLGPDTPVEADTPPDQTPQEQTPPLEPDTPPLLGPDIPPGADTPLAAATAQTRPSNSVPMAGLGGFQVGGRPIVLRQLLLW